MKLKLFKCTQCKKSIRTNKNDACYIFNIKTSLIFFWKSLLPWELSLTV